MGERSDLDDLDERLIDAHNRGELGELVELYRRAGKAAIDGGDGHAARFYYTHAYVFALEAGHPQTSEILAVLKRHGSE